MIELQHAVIQIIASVIDLPETEILPDMTFTALQIDSILFIKIVVECESAFQIEFEDEVLIVDYFKTLQAFIDYIHNLIQHN